MKPGVVVFLAAFAILSWNLWNIGIASGYIDPVMHFGAQDEATYTREAIHMAREGGWMTPTFLGRWVFEKPPLLMWLCAVSMKLFGIGRLSARLPVVLAGALICALCFAIVRRYRSTAAGVAAAAMAVSSQILFTMSRHSMTDILLAASGMCAFAILLRDPKLAGRWSFVSFVIAASAGMLAKSIAGILVLAVMFVVVGFGSRQWARSTVAAALSILLASPWFLYNFFVHRDWFLADIGYQLITVGTAGHQTSPGNALTFYAIRILNSDLIPLVLAITGVPVLLRSLRRRDSAALLAAAYCAIYFAALMVFHFHSEQYACAFVPSLVLIAGLYSPLLNGRSAWIVIGVIAIAFALKLAGPEQTFGISMQSGSNIAAAPVLSQYCGEHRANDLYVFEVDDEFYSAALPLHRVRYGWVDPADVVAREHPHLAYLGILIPASEFPTVDGKLPLYQSRLSGWGMESTRAVATGITAHDAAELQRIIRDHPESDFLVARSIVPDPQAEISHRVEFANADFSLLESKTPAGRETPKWSCGM